MVTYVQSGKGFQTFSFPSDLVYYTRIFNVRTTLFIPSDYNGNVFLGAINRYHKIGQIFFMSEGYVLEQHFLEFTQQNWGNFIPFIDIPLPIFIELDGSTLGEPDSDPEKHINPATQHFASLESGRLHFINMLRDLILDAPQSLAYYTLNASLRFFAKYKPGLYSQMRVVDQVVVECFRDDVVVELRIEGVR